MTAERLVYLPLGGAGEIGMNMYLYGWGAPGRERWIMVDAGVTFPSMDGSPGVDLIMPDTDYISTRTQALEAIFITHGHEDHIGAIGHLRSRLGSCPVYTRRFTSVIAAHKFASVGREGEDLRVAKPMPDMIEAGPFKVGFLPVSHSIPEASAIVIDTPAGRVLHSGDLKLDTSPVLGEAFDAEAFTKTCAGGIRAFVCDSTNVFSTAPGRSEAEIVPHIEALMREAEGMVVATTFASNLARLTTLAEAAAREGRAVVLLGRAMNRMAEFAREAGLMDGLPNLVSPKDAGSIPRQHLFALSTGSQGEPRAASAALARDSYLGIDLREGDTFLFSSKTIPGNEVDVARLINGLAEKGVRVVEEDPRYHVSGHANRPDLERLHALVNADLIVPMHGEYRHLKEHAELAQAAGRKAAIAPNGTMLDLTGTPGEIEEHVETGRLYLDGSVLIGALDGVVRDRVRMALRGLVAVSVVIDEEGRPLEGVWVDVRGLPQGAPDALRDALEEAIDADLSYAKRAELSDDDALEERITRAVRRICKEEVEKRPEVSVLINRLA